MHERFRNAVDCFYIASCDSEWTTIAYYNHSMFFNTHQSGVLTALFAYYMAGTTWNYCYHSAHSVCTIQPCTSLHCYFKWSHIGKVHACLPEWMGPFTCCCSNTGWSWYQNRNHTWEHFFRVEKTSGWTCIRECITLKNTIVLNQELTVTSPLRKSLFQIRKRQLHPHEEHRCFKSGRGSYITMKNTFFQIRKRQLHPHEEHRCFKLGRGSYITMKNIILSNQEEAVTSPWRTLLFQIRKRQLHPHEEHHCFKSGRGSYITMKNIIVSNQEEAVYFPDHCLLLAHPCIKEYKHYHTKQYCLESGRDSLLPRQFHLLLRQFNFLLTVYVLFVLYCMRLKWQLWLPPWINKVYIIIVIVRP